MTVAVPFYGAPHLLPRCVDSLLAQTYQDLRVLVIADGQEIPPLPPDPRLTVHRLPENRGVYFAQAVALAACESEWFSIHAHDDWSEPDRFSRLMAHTQGVDVVFGGSMQHQGRRVEKRPVHFDEGGVSPRHIGSIASGVYRTAAVKSLGWWSHPEFRVGYDSLMVNLVVRHLRWRHLDDEAGYHRVVRLDSLTRKRQTAIRSRYRKQANRRRRQIWNTYADRPADIPVDPSVAAEVLKHARLILEAE